MALCIFISSLIYVKRTKESKNSVLILESELKNSLKAQFRNTREHGKYKSEHTYVWVPRNIYTLHAPDKGFLAGED